MTESQPGFFYRFFRGAWWLFNSTRIVVLNVIFFLILLLFLAAVLRDPAPVIGERTTLLVDPAGLVVEQYSSDPVERAIDQAIGQPRLEARFRELLRAVERARDDDRIAQIVLDLDAMLAIGPAQMAELVRALTAFRDAGKPVLAWSEGMLQDQYYVAAAADEIWLHPEGLVLLEGYGIFRNYYKELLDKLDVDVHLFRVGEYKSAAEPYVRNDMSAESREANRYWLGGLWDRFLVDVSALRGLDREAFERGISNPADGLAAAGGSAARMALEQGLIDRIATRDAFVERVLERGAPADGQPGFRSIGFEAYARSPGSFSAAPDKVAVVVAQGPIMFGDQPPGTIGGDTIVRQIREAREDPRVKAIVLRVDSPGGAVLPSEKIRAALATVRADGIPVIVSMGTVAASGGYWISMAADEIVAEATTITGSIGIFGMVATIPETLARIGIHTDGVGTAPLAGAFRLDRPLGEEASALFQLIIEDGYRDFISRVAEARAMDEAAVDRVARGRVWTGAQALDRGLVDRLGGLSDAVALAAERAGLEDWGTLYFEEKPTQFEQFLLEMSGSALARLAGWASSRDPLSALALATGGKLPEDLALLLGHPRDGLAAYAYCFCRP